MELKLSEFILFVISETRVQKIFKTCFI